MKDATGGSGRTPGTVGVVVSGHKKGKEKGEVEGNKKDNVVRLLMVLSFSLVIWT